MRVVIQRVSEAKVVVDEVTTGSIKTGLLILVGIEEEDDENDVDWLVKKLSLIHI